MYWRVWLVEDDELATEWAVVDIEGDFLVIARQSVVEREPGRITTEVVRELKRQKCPTRPLQVVA